MAAGPPDSQPWPLGFDEARLRPVLERLAGAMTGVFYAFRRAPDGRTSVPFAVPSMESIWGSFAGCDLAVDAAPLFDRISTADRDRVLAAIRESAESHRPFRADFRVNHPEKGELWLAAASTASREADGGVVWLGHAQDITARVRLEQRYGHTQRLEAMGQLAGGIAHEFNNLLTVIIGNGDMVLESMGADDPDRPLMEDTLQASRRAASLTQRLLTFTRRQLSSPQDVRLTDVVRALAPQVRHLAADNARLTLDLNADADDVRVRVDPAQVALLLEELVVNARDAMPSGGTLAIRIGRASDQAVRLRCPELPPGRYVELAVQDTGVGMTDDVKSRLFEPFFTTKGEAHATGLGLPTALGIVREWGGAIEVESRAGEGSTFRIFLPAIDADRGPAG